MLQVQPLAGTAAAVAASTSLRTTAGTSNSSKANTTTTPALGSVSHRRSLSSSSRRADAVATQVASSIPKGPSSKSSLGVTLFSLNTLTSNISSRAHSSRTGMLLYSHPCKHSPMAPCLLALLPFQYNRSRLLQQRRQRVWSRRPPQPQPPACLPLSLSLTRWDPAMTCCLQRRQWMLHVRYQQCLPQLQLKDEWRRLLPARIVLASECRCKVAVQKLVTALRNLPACQQECGGST